MDDFTGADIESLCKKAALLAIVEFRNRARTPFAVERSDFLAVLESDRGNPRQAEIAEESVNRAGDLRSGASPRKQEGGS